MQTCDGENETRPRQTLSILKLELNAALLGARLANYIANALDIPEIGKMFFTDSSTRRNWIRAVASFYLPHLTSRQYKTIKHSLFGPHAHSWLSRSFFIKNPILKLELWNFLSNVDLYNVHTLKKLVKKSQTEKEIS